MGFEGIRVSIVFVCVAIGALNILTTLSALVSKTIPVPFIDEVFHVPQAQAYCLNNFYEWNDKITTPPGLYLISLAIIKPLEKSLGLELCTVHGLRLVNVCGTMLNFILCYLIQQKLRRSKTVDQGGYLDVMSAINIAAFPPLFFFSFLYYTDVWSTTFVLLMYFFHIANSPLLGAISGLFSIFMRQTNVIWVGLYFLDAAWTSLVGDKYKRVKSLTEASKLLVDKLKRPFFWRVLLATAPYIMVGCLFFGFVVINGGIVLGDKSAHSVVFHPMQNLYFLAIAAFFSAPYILFEVQGLWGLRHQLPLFCTVWLLFALISEFNFMEHPYLLSDNRHIAFYAWKRIFGKLSLRRLLTPIYVISAIFLFKLVQHRSFVFILIVTLCTVLNLTPQGLFEFRYFIIPFIMLRLHYPKRKPAIFIETVFFMLINAAVYYQFVTRKFQWPSDPGVFQHIIW